MYREPVTESANERTDGTGLIWERPEPPSRPAPSPLSRDRIVTVAVRLADTDGLSAVSLRRVAAELGAGPMRLYGYLSTKDELLDLMVDAVYGEITPPARSGDDWRTALRTLAHDVRRTALRHEWFVDLIGGRPHIGPNALAYSEAGMAILDGAPGFDRIEVVLRAFGVFSGFLVGALRGEISERRAERATGMTERDWQAATGAYLGRMLATGRFPIMARIVADVEHPDDGTAFDDGLAYVLDGIAARTGASG